MTRGRSGYPITKIMSPEVGKWVTVNVNGNAHHEARILISPYTMRQFENLLSHLTDKLKPPFGAVWRLFTESGVEIKDLDDIKGGHTYIASGRARPMFPVRMGLKSGRGRRDRDAAGHGQRGLRSHSAVGSLGGGVDGGGGSARDGARVADAASDTNVKHKHTLARSAPGPRRGVGKARVGDGPLDGLPHSQQQAHHQQPPPTTKRKQSGHKAHHEEYFEGDEAGRTHQNHLKK